MNDREWRALQRMTMNEGYPTPHQQLAGLKPRSLWMTLVYLKLAVFTGIVIYATLFA